jgi:hypothetical protein
MRWRWLLVLLTAIVVLPFSALYVLRGTYGLNVVLHRGGSIWPTMSRDDPRLTPAVRLALSGKTGLPGKLDWTEPKPGFEVGELPILVDGVAVDRVLLARIDPKLWRFAVHSAPAGDHSVDLWMTELKAALVVNGSYFGLKGQPDTPFKSDGVMMGPSQYDASHGAFVASADGANVVDLKGQDWRQIFATKQNAMVSYPLLLDETGASRAKPSEWLAGRSFVAQDRLGKIVIGTTADAFLSLDRLADVLKAPSLNLAVALNLDGGPVACQSIDLGVYRRRTCGPQELQVSGKEVQLLQPVFAGDWTLPIVLSVSPK